MFKMISINDCGILPSSACGHKLEGVVAVFDTGRPVQLCWQDFEVRVSGLLPRREPSATCDMVAPGVLHVKVTCCCEEWPRVIHTCCRPAPFRSDRPYSDSWHHSQGRTDSRGQTQTE